MSTDYQKHIGVKSKDGEPVSLHLRPLRSSDDYEKCVALERAVWGQGFNECVPPSMLMINQKIGGLSAGAFHPDGRLWGMIYGLTGFRDGVPIHWSHLLGVDNAARGLGLGRELKLYQREFLLGHGVKIVEWTYDPLESRNASLNLNRLGALPVEYALDVYGPGDSSGLHAGIGTDRFIVRWQLDQTNGSETARHRFPADAPVVNVDCEAEPLEGEYDLPDLAAVRVRIPFSIQAAKNERAGLGRLWRLSTRHAFTNYLGRGYAVTCFLMNREQQDCYYGLQRLGEES